MGSFGPFLLGFLLAGIVGITLVYSCYSKRELTEKNLRQSINNLEHNLEVMRKEYELRIEQLTIDVKRAKDETKKAAGTIEVLHRNLASSKQQFEECKKRLEAETF